MNDTKPTPRQEPKAAAAARNQPVHRIRKFRIEAAIWQNQSENGTWYNVALSRSYKDGLDTNLAGAEHGSQCTASKSASASRAASPGVPGRALPCASPASLFSFCLLRA